MLIIDECIRQKKDPCWGWLIEEWMDEFLIEKYIEISTDISTDIIYANPDPHSFNVT